MSKIAFIAPYEQMLTVGKKVINDLGLSLIITSYLGSLNQGVAIAQRLEMEGTEVIVSRGGTAELIVSSGVKTPVVEISITPHDLAQALIEAKKLTGLDNPKIAVLAFKNMIYDIEPFSKVMELDLDIYYLDAEDDIAITVEKALQKNVDVVVGGLEVTRLAAQQGVTSVLLTSGEGAFQSAFMQAVKVTYARKIEKERMQKFRVLVDYSIQGIIGIDCDKKINVFNPSAAKLLRLHAVQVLGKGIDTFFPEFPIDKCLDEDKEFIGQIIKINHVTVIANIVPITVETKTTGVMITFEDVSKIVAMEAQIRKEIFTKGFSAQYAFDDICGISPEIIETKRIAKEYADIDATVFIFGPSGTGKELFAQSIHNHSKRRNGPFVAINCAAIPTSLLESELFGYVEGAFTGANKKGKAGMFEMAHKGTIFLDEIAEMDRYAQSRLLRIIQERRVMRLGDDKSLPVDVRIIAATNKDLVKMVGEDKFREDLYYRLNVLPLRLPALHERIGDIIFIAEHFLAVYNQMFNKDISLSEPAKGCLSSYKWPGNIRQLMNFIERLVIITKKPRIELEAVRGLLENREIVVRDDGRDEASVDSSDKNRIIQVLKSTGYNQKQAAEKLGINRSTLYRKLKSYKIEVKKSCT